MSIELNFTPSARTRHSYDVYLGDTLISTSCLPLFDGARVLLASGYDPRTSLSMRYRGATFVSMRSTIGSAAKLTVIENSRQGPVYGPYEPYPLKDQRKAEKQSDRRIKSERQGGVTSGNEARLAI